jgi:hypothetical protein
VLKLKPLALATARLDKICYKCFRITATWCFMSYVANKELSDVGVLQVERVPRALLAAFHVAAYSRRMTMRDLALRILREAVKEHQREIGGTLLYQDLADLEGPPKGKPPIFRVVPADYRKRRKGPKAAQSSPEAAPSSRPSGK